MSSNATLQHVVISMNKALATLLIHAGIDGRQFVHLAKLGYVAAVEEACEREGKRASISRVSRVTGLSRAEAKRLLDELHECGLQPVMTSSAEGVALHFWHTIPAFLDESGQPRTIALGPGDGTFTDLVANYVGDADAAARRRDGRVADARQRVQSSGEPPAFTGAGAARIRRRDEYVTHR